MTEREAHQHFPLLPEPWPRPVDQVPAVSPVAADRPATSAPASEPQVSGPVAVEVPTATGPEPEASTSPQETPKIEEAVERQRVTVVGRLGHDPRIRTTAKGTLVAQFSLGVKDDANLNMTTWHKVVAFDQRAAQVRDTLKRGDPVEVIGYLHTREYARRDGTSRVIEEVYATVIKPR